MINLMMWLCKVMTCDDIIFISAAVRIPNEYLGSVEYVNGFVIKIIRQLHDTVFDNQLKSAVDSAIDRVDSEAKSSVAQA